MNAEYTIMSNVLSENSALCLEYSHNPIGLEPIMASHADGSQSTGDDRVSFLEWMIRTATRNASQAANATCGGILS
jgi:hypothetical protein